jgi:ketosteroid isomerase-like protein
MGSERAIAVRLLIERYIASFNASDFEVAMACYRLPFTWFYGSGAPTVSSRDEFIAIMTKTKKKLVVAGLGQSLLIDCTVRMLGDQAAMAGVTVSRTRFDGSELERTGGSYLVYDKGDGWHLAAFVDHPLDQIIPGIAT